MYKLFLEGTNLILSKTAIFSFTWILYVL